MVVAKSFVEYKKGNSSNPKLSKGSHTKGRGDKGLKDYSVVKEESSKTYGGKEDKNKYKWKEFMSKTHDFICDGPYYNNSALRKRSLMS